MMKDKKQNTVAIYIAIVCTCALLFSSCSIVKGASKVAWGTAKVGGKVVWGTTKLVGSGLKTTVNIINGKTVVPLRKQGNSMFVKVRINRRSHTELLVDTGASQTQISMRLAQRLGLDLSKSKPLVVRLADGKAVEAQQIYLNELRIGRAVVRNIPVVVFRYEQDKGYDGLLGMTFLNEFIFQIDSQKAELILRKRNN